jgi:hypothetical protein
MFSFEQSIPMSHPKILGAAVQNYSYDDLLNMDIGHTVEITQTSTQEFGDIGYIFLGMYKGISLYVPARIMSDGKAIIYGKVEAIHLLGVC